MNHGAEESIIVIVGYRVIESVIENGAKRGRWLSGYRVIEEVTVQSSN
jgi:hypothetical protein